MADKADKADRDQLRIFQTIGPGEEAKIRESLISIVDMVRAKIETGEVESMAFLMVAKDPKTPGGKAYTGSRMIIRPTHLDLIDDVYKQMMAELSKHYGITPDQLRKDRNRER
jgi:hypothetical protein